MGTCPGGLDVERFLEVAELFITQTLSDMKVFLAEYYPARGLYPAGNEDNG